MRGNKLYIVVPCYNEEEVILQTAGVLKDAVSAMVSKGLVSSESRIVFVDDGSKDGTWPLISELFRTDKTYVGLKLSRNRGHQNALLAGLFYAAEKCDMAISMDADLQDDVAAAEEMVKKYLSGCEIVYGVRSSRKKDTAFKRGTAEGFYKLMSSLGVDIVYNHADYRLMSRTAIQALIQYKEVNLFLRGIVPQLGYMTDTVEYERGERAAGESKYPLKKMLSFAWDGITSFSVKPLRAVTVTGAAIACVSFAAIIVLFILMLCGIKISGWTAASVWLACGILMLSTGLVGEYVGKIYSEVKSRPRFFIETVLESASISADTADNDIIRAILSRRSVRKYTSDPVGHELLAKIVECGKFAATAKGIQPWFFSVVESRRILDAISEANRMVMLDSSDENMRKRASEPNFDSFRGAPCAIIVSGMKDNSYSEADCANACENMLIAAESIGLSTCYIASFKTAFESEAGASITKLLKIPDGYSPRFAVAVGYGCENLGERAPRRENITEYIK